MSSIKGSIWDHEDYKAYKSRWQRRIAALQLRQAYYDGSIYRREELNWASFKQLAPRLYKGIKPLYLMLSRAVDIDAGIIPGGWKLAEDAPAAWGEAIKQVFAWSDWSVDGVLYIHYGAQYGLSGLKVCDVPDETTPRVMIKPLDPCCFMLIESSRYDQTAQLAIICEMQEGADGPEEYAEVITATEIVTYIDGVETAIGDRPSRYPNNFGFVPVVEIQHKKMGKALCEATYSLAIPLLDELNELASYLADIIRKHAEAQWALIGAEPGDLEKSGDNVWYIPAGGDVKAIVAPIDVTGVLHFIQEIRDQVKEALAELAFDELKKSSNIATATVELQLKELVLKILRSRPNYDHGLADALRMCGRAADALGLAQLKVLDDELLGFDPERPVIPLDKLTELQIKATERALEQFEQEGVMEGQGGQGDETDDEDEDDESDQKPKPRLGYRIGGQA